MKTVWHIDLRTEAEERISLNKPWRVMCETGLHLSQTIIAAPADRGDLVRAHSYDFVTGVLNNRLPNGFGETGARAKHHLPHILAANGVMIKAVQAALDDPRDVVFAPVSGFHHAEYDNAQGFCTFNGLHVAIAAARLKKRLPNVLIIDGDIHYGNGTHDISAKLGLGGILNLTHDAPGLAGVANTLPLSPKTWEPTIRGLLTNRQWDLVIYQAGADAHIDDPMGQGYLDDYEWEARDRLVFQYCQRIGLPLVFNLAGGYNDDKTVWLHAQTVKMARLVYGAANRAAAAKLEAPEG